MKKFIIDSSYFSDFKSFLDYSLSVFTWGTISEIDNLDALEDILEGGFGGINEGEEFKIIWKDARKSYSDLGYIETQRYYLNLLKECHPSNREEIKFLLNISRKEIGKTLFEIIVEIFLENDNIIIELR